MKKIQCDTCGDELSEMFRKSLHTNIPDRFEGRGICLVCGKGCVEYIIPSATDHRSHANRHKQHFGICCNCGTEGIEPIRQQGGTEEGIDEQGRKPKLPTLEEMRLEYERATDEEREFAKSILGHDPFSED